MTQTNQTSANVINGIDVEQFLEQNRALIERAAVRNLAKVPYDLSLGYDELRDDAICEAFVAVHDAIRLYKPGLSAIATFINTKVYWHFKELQRQNARHDVRETLRSRIEGDFACDGDDDHDCTDYLESGAADDAFLAEQRQAEILSALTAVRRFATKASHRACVDTLLEAFRQKVDQPVPFTAERLDVSKQQVYNILKDVVRGLPDELAEEIRELF